MVLVVEHVVVENPVETDCRPSSGAAAFRRLTFDVKFFDGDGRLLIAMLAMRVQRGNLTPPVRYVHDQPVATAAWGGHVGAAVVDACRAAGWFERYPKVVWPL